MSHIKIKDSVVFITGANRGIGRAMVEAALELDAKKVYAAARKTDQLADLVSANPDRVIDLELDVTNQDQIKKAAEQAPDVNILINNAGVAGYSGFTVNHKPEEARKELEVNYFGMLYVSTALVPALKRNKEGVIANVISVGGLANFPFAATYCASKAAAHSLTQGLRAELAEEGVFVAGIYPGPVDTDMAAGVDMEKETPKQVALNSFKALEECTESIFPDKFAVDFSKSLQPA